MKKNINMFSLILNIKLKNKKNSLSYFSCIGLAKVKKCNNNASCCHTLLEGM